MMAKSNSITVRFRLPIEVAERFDAIAKRENKTHDQMFQYMFWLYVEEEDEREWRQLRKYGERTAKRLGITKEEDVVRLIHEVRAEEISGKDCSGLSDEEIDEILCKKH